MEINRICCTTINIWLTYRIPVGSRRIPSDPTLSDNFRLSETVGSDIRQLPIGILSQGIRQLPTGSYRKLSDGLGFPVGSDGRIARPGYTYWCIDHHFVICLCEFDFQSHFLPINIIIVNVTITSISTMPKNVLCCLQKRYSIFLNKKFFLLCHIQNERQ